VIAQQFVVLEVAVHEASHVLARQFLRLAQLRPADTEIRDQHRRRVAAVEFAQM